MANKFTQREVKRGDAAARGKSEALGHRDADDAMVVTKMRRGQKILSAYPLDTSDMELPNERGGEMGGGVTNVSHSLRGGSVVSR
jgi:hypothetical protein